MRIIMMLFVFLTIPVIAFSQNASLSKCWRYEVDCFRETFLVLSVQNIKDKPDTTYQLTIAEIIKLNNFLDAHQLYSKKSISNSPHPLDMRVVFLFGDNSGKRHELGFDCNGNYELDGIAYSYNINLSNSINELKIGNSSN